MNMKNEKNILIAFILNLLFSIFEFIGGIITGSVAIISDSVHDIGDAISIGISYVLEKISVRSPDNKYTYGYVRYSTLGGLITTVVLIVGSILVIISSIKRITNPIPIDYSKMIVIAFIGFFVNFIAAYVTKDGHSINQKSVNLHMLEDVLGWVVVLIGAFLMKLTNINIIDPIMSIAVALFILIHAFKNLMKVMDLFLEKNYLDIDMIKQELLKIDGVEDVHHIHIWSIDGIDSYATLHVVSQDYMMKKSVKDALKKYGINHATVEIELNTEVCDDLNCNIRNYH